jgi:hypothetical protein
VDIFLRYGKQKLTLNQQAQGLLCRFILFIKILQLEGKHLSTACACGNGMKHEDNNEIKIKKTVLTHTFFSTFLNNCSR